MSKKRGLGRGLDALFQENEELKEHTETLRLSDIEPNRDQPRKNFDDEHITTLADSIKEHGIIQPLVVRPMPSGVYQIIAGERRYRASRMVGLEKVPVKIIEVSDKEAMEIALVENLQREDLNPLEEADGYNRLMEEYGLTQDETAKRVGKSRSTVANSLRLINLPNEVKEYLKKGSLSGGQARALLAFKEDQKINRLADEVIKKGMSVREIERLSSKSDRVQAKGDTNYDKRDNFYKELEISLQQEIGRKVSVEVSGKNKGTLKVEFYSKEDLTDMAYRIANLRRR